MPEARVSYPFVPRYRFLAWLAIGTGAVLIGYGFYTGEGRALALAMGVMGIVLGLVYQASPVWKLRIVPFADADAAADSESGAASGGLRVLSGDTERFALRFDEIEELIVSPASKTCFVHAGQSDRSILLPGPGANASYDIDGKHELYELLQKSVPGERIREVEHLGKWLRQRRRQGPMDDGEKADEESA